MEWANGAAHRRSTKTASGRNPGRSTGDARPETSGFHLPAPCLVFGPKVGRGAARLATFQDTTATSAARDDAKRNHPQDERAEQVPDMREDKREHDVRGITREWLMDR